GTPTSETCAWTCSRPTAASICCTTAAAAAATTSSAATRSTCRPKTSTAPGACASPIAAGATRAASKAGASRSDASAPAAAVQDGRVGLRLRPSCSSAAGPATAGSPVRTMPSGTLRTAPPVVPCARRWPMRRTGSRGIVSVLSALLCAACSGVPGVDPDAADAADASRAQPALHAQTTATGAREHPAAVLPATPVPATAAPRKVHPVSSRATFRGLSGLATARGLHRDPSGTDLVVSEVDANRLDDVAGIVHRTERRCGGFFAFDTRAEAEAFLRSDRSAQAIDATAASYTLDNRSTVDHWLPQVREARI